MEKCVICMRGSGPVCAACQQTYPAPLLLACTDKPCPYVLALWDHTVIKFTGAEIAGEWVYLENPDSLKFGPHGIQGTQRGMAVRISAIVWCLQEG